MIQIFRGYVRTKDKKPIQKFKGIDDLPCLEEISNFDEYAGILNNDYTVMDVDEKDEAERTYKLVCDENLNCRVTKTTRGMHFIFKKNSYASKGNTHQTNAIGFTFDIRTGENQYIVVKKDGKVREVIRDFDESRDITEYPKYFAPIRSDEKFTAMKDGDGRNGKLFNYIITLVKNGYNKDECVQIINFINKYAFDDPLTDYEIKQITRDESFKGIEISNVEEDFGDAYKPQAYSDIAMAELFVKHNKETMRYNPATDWLVWNGTKWEMSELAGQQKYIGFIKEVMECAKKELAKAYSGNKDNEQAIKKANKFYNYVLKMSDSGKISGVLKIAKSLMQLDISELDANPFELNTPDGIIELRTGEIRDHEPSALCTKMTMCSPGDDGKKEWDTFLKMITVNDANLEAYLQYIAGAIVIGKVYNEALIIAHGTGANGKSTFFNTIAKVLGDYAGKIPAESLTTRAKNIKVDLAELLGKRFVLASETEEGQRLSTSMLKQIASVDSVTGEKKYHDPFTFEPTHQTVLYTNFLPRVGANDNGTWRRIVVAPFKANITNPQKDYAEQLQTTSSKAVLKWIIEGAKKFIDNKYNLPDCKAVVDAIDKYREDNDWLSSFINDCCNTGELEKAAGGQLYKAYRNWCQETGEYIRCNRDFAEVLRVAGYTMKKTNKGNIWTGISLDATATVKDEFL